MGGGYPAAPSGHFRGLVWEGVPCSFFWPLQESSVGGGYPAPSSGLFQKRTGGEGH